MNANLKPIFDCFVQLKWPASIDTTEPEFNKDLLLNLLKQMDCLSDLEHIDEKELRNPDALPLFGWGGCGKNFSKINGNVKSDLTFKKDGISILVENKLIRNGKNEECNIKNAIVQTIEYLNLYKVAGALLLIFDAGRAKDREWENSAEKKLLDSLLSNYPLCIVRIRKDCETKIYYEDRTQ